MTTTDPTTTTPEGRATLPLRPGRDETARLAGRVSVAAGRETREVRSPLTGEVLGEVPVGTAEDVSAAFARARDAQRVGRPATEGAGRGPAALPRPGPRPPGRAARPHPGRERQGPGVGLRGDHGPGGHRPVLRPPGARALRPQRLRRAAGAGVDPGPPPAEGRGRRHLAVELPAGAGHLRRARRPGGGQRHRHQARLADPFTALRAFELLEEAGLPAGLVQVVTGPGRTVGTAIIEASDYMMFTGSGHRPPWPARPASSSSACRPSWGARTPWSSPATPSSTGPSTRPWSARSPTPASCASPSSASTWTSRWPTGSSTPSAPGRRRCGSGPSRPTGPRSALASQDQLDKVRAHVDGALAKGARLVAGGRHRPDIGALFYEPTVLAGVTPDMDLYREETFGPWWPSTRGVRRRGGGPGQRHRVRPERQRLLRRHRAGPGHRPAAPGRDRQRQRRLRLRVGQRGRADGRHEGVGPRPAPWPGGPAQVHRAPDHRRAVEAGRAR